MIFDYPDRDKLRTELVERYDRLPRLEKQIVQLLSVIYTPVSHGLLINYLQKIGLKDCNKKDFNFKSLRPYINSLIDLGVLTNERSQGLQCNPLLTEIVTRDLIKTGDFEVWATVIQPDIPPTVISRITDSQLIRDIRIRLYRQDAEGINQLLASYAKSTYQKDKLSAEEIFVRIANNPFDRDWLRSLNQALYEPILTSILYDSVLHFHPAHEAFALLEDDCFAQESPDMDGHTSNHLWLTLSEQFLLKGCVQNAEKCLAQIPKDSRQYAAPLWGWICFLRGEYESSIEHYTTALINYRKATRKRKLYFNTIAGLFFILALLKRGTTQDLQQAQEYTDIVASQTNHWLRTTYARLKNMVQLQQGDLANRDVIVDLCFTSRTHQHSLETLLTAYCLYWVNADEAKNRLPNILEIFYRQALEADYHWFAIEAAELLAKLRPNSSYVTQADSLRQPTGIVPLMHLLQAQEPWELCLNALANLHKEPKAKSQANTALRLVWFITLAKNGSYTLQPREQKINKQGVWSRGRTIALKRLNQELETFDYLTEQDIRACQHIRRQAQRYYYDEALEFGEKTIVTLIGHPLVFWADAPTVPVEIVSGEPQLLITKAGAGKLILSISPKPTSNKDILIVKESPTRLKVVEITEEHNRIANILGKSRRLEVPLFAKDKVLAAIKGVANIVTIQSDIGGVAANAEEVTAETRPYVHLLPAGEGLKVALLSHPFPQAEGPYFRPGKGGETVIAEIEGKQFQTTRNLKQEKQLAKSVLKACPTLMHEEEEEGEWVLQNPENCLELLMELQDLNDTVVVEWPEGEKFKISHRAGLNNFNLNIKRQQDWFAASGELKLSDDMVLGMQQLMELLAQSDSRFVPLGNGEFLALTKQFRKRLDEMQMIAEVHGDGLRFHPLATLALEDTLDEVGYLKADKHWKAHIKRLKEMQNLQPTVPTTLQAELRDYQIEGFEWLARLSHWGVGACLADDMGLGKTLQALAAILLRAPQGPTLIIAPTSVCLNWMTEAQRFTPTLNPIEFGSKDRQIVLDALSPFDLLICSYGLLQQEDVAEMLAKVEWQTVVLDEAQAIKNMATKRSKGAMTLQSQFKLITTGTPIENHLGELWNLFRFINPGLLGSLERFQTNFATPIEKYNDKQARTKLKKLIQPFLLRRTKSQVLQELPPRTDILLHVDLSPEEMAFYEALRRDAVAKLTESDATAGQKHLQVLAEIMKLRRACCNPQLVKPEVALSSSKLQVFSEVLADLVDNRHKALVFSQFVDHLHIIRDHLDQQNIHYQYLDGSTAAKDRKTRVEAFQSGQGDVFLISLKAGGTGLNLTAADYVIHMDPWWNPAVEDQASDRAHRIGQQRPVTIYRLIARGTIEEKIVELHHHKRDLADTLLEGADLGGKMSTDELLSLISQG